MNRIARSRAGTPIETMRYALLVDHQVKRDFDERDAAEQEARRIRSRFPHLRVTVEDREASAKGH
jgi:hypothetical protein